MTLACELPTILKEIQGRIEAIQYGETWKKAHSSELSPVPSLGSTDPSEQRRTSQKKPDAQAAKQSEAAKAQSKAKNIVFELPKDLERTLAACPNYRDDAFKIERIRFNPTTQSGLSAIIGHVQKIDCVVFVPHHKRPVRLKVPQTATFVQLLQGTIKKHNETKPKVPLIDDTDAYIVRIATDEGRLDDMYPPVALKRQVDEWLNQPFLLVENPNYVRKDKGDKGVMDTVVTVVIKAILPNGAYHTLAFEKTTKMSKVLKAFCEKRSLMPHDYTLQSLTDPPTYITRDMRVSDLKEVGVRLVPKSDIATIIDPDDAEIFWYDSLAMAFKTYNVVLLKNKGKPFTTSKQERVMGIDGERITHTVIKKKGASSKPLPPNAIKDVKQITIIEEKPGSFILEFKDSKPMTFEAPSYAIAKEIVGKVQYLLQMDKRTN